MKHLLFSIAAILICGTATAQYDENMKMGYSTRTSSSMVVVEFGPRVGMNYASVSGEGAKGTGGIIGLNLGGTLELKMRSRFSLSIDVLYSAQGYNKEELKEKTVISYLLAPVMANFYVTSRFSVKAGVQPSMMVGAKHYVKGDWQTVTGDYAKFDIAIPIGIAYMFPYRIEADLRYNIGLMSISTGNNPTMRNSVFTLSLTRKF